MLQMAFFVIGVVICIYLIIFAVMVAGVMIYALRYMLAGIAGLLVLGWIWPPLLAITCFVVIPIGGFAVGVARRMREPSLDSRAYRLGNWTARRFATDQRHTNDRVTRAPVST